MIKKTIVAVLILFAMVSAKPANANMLVDMLMSKLGVTETQANAGTGVLLKYLKSQVSGEDFNTVSEGIEGGASSYMRAADEAGAYKESMSKLGRTQASVNAPGLLGNAANPFKKLGMKSAMIAQFGDIIVSYLKKKGKEKAMNIFAKMLEN
jgi:hypothetical protein